MVVINISINLYKSAGFNDCCMLYRFVVLRFRVGVLVYCCFLSFVPTNFKHIVIIS